MIDNMKIWKALEKTDPHHTKGFKRSGGFAGTATKPIYSIKRMTEQFGPCGEGWGMTSPAFQTVGAGDEILVYCTVALWHGNRDNLVYGVGGDKVRALQKSGPFNSDEAFKASYTDALSNAMKLIGVSADIHMGLFEDDKYMRELREEFSEDKPDHDGYVANATAWMRKQTDAATINQTWSTEFENYTRLPADLQKKLIGIRDEVLASLTAKPQVDEWKIIADDIKREIDEALDTVAIGEIIDSKRLADLTAHSKSAGKFLTDRARNRVATIMQRRAA